MIKLEKYKALEIDLARWIGVDDIITCSTGTAALHLALESMGVKHNQRFEVIIPDYTMVACALSVSMAGMIPVPVDCTGNDLLIDVGLIEQEITDKTKAIMAVHVYGRMCDMQAIHDIASKYDLFVIEDMAEAHGCIVHPSTHAACWSFYKNKVVYGEEGGCLYVKDESKRKLVRQLRNMGFNEPHDYTHIPYGHNYRLSNVHASMILDRLSAVRDYISIRRYIESEYDRYCPLQWKMPKRACPWVYDIRIPMMSSDLQSQVVVALRERGIEARHGFKPISQLPQFQCYIGDTESSAASREVIYLPISPGSYEIGQAETAFTIIRSIVR